MSHGIQKSNLPVFMLIDNFLLILIVLSSEKKGGAWEERKKHITLHLSLMVVALSLERITSYGDQLKEKVKRHRGIFKI